MTPAEELDAFLAKLCLYREARGESTQAKAAIFAVLRNRVAEPHRFGATLAEVVTRPWQFSSFNRNDANVTAWPKPNSPEWQSWLDCCAVYDTPLTADPTDGAQFYHDDSIPPPAEAWLGKGKTAADLEALKTCQIGRLSFYRIPA